MLALICVTSIRKLNVLHLISKTISRVSKEIQRIYQEMLEAMIRNEKKDLKCQVYPISGYMYNESYSVNKG